MRGLILLGLMTGCGVADTGILLCPPGTLSTSEGCVPVGDGGMPPFDGGGKPARIEAIPAQVNFGRVAVGGTYSQLVQFLNSGNEDVRVRVASISGAGYSMLEIPIGGDFVVPAQSTVDRFFFLEARGASSDAVFTFETCENDCPLQVTATAQLIDEALRCEGGDFGSTPVAECRFNAVVCRNVTDHAVTIDNVSSRNRGWFDLFGPLGLTVGPQMSIDFGAEFCPFEPGEHSATFDVSSRIGVGPDRNNTQVRLSGTAVDGMFGFLECERFQSNLGPIPVGGSASDFIQCFVIGDIFLQRAALFPGTTPELTAELLVDGRPAAAPIGLIEGQIVDVQLIFTPQQEGQHFAGYELLWDSGGWIIDITATTFNQGGCALDYIQQANLGIVQVGSASNLQTSIANVGAAPCTVELFGLDAMSDPAFTITTPAVPQTFLLNPGGFLDVAFRFSPLMARDHFGLFVFFVPELPNPNQFIDLIGTGMGAPATCGNGLPDPGEQCDDGNEIFTDACVECANATCGDGFLRLTLEQCDDGNQNDMDACNNACGWNSPGYAVIEIPSVPLPPLPGIVTPITFMNPDDGQSQIPLNFPFEFADQSVFDVWVGTNGLIAFDPASVSVFNNADIPTFQAPNGIVAWFWDDLTFGQMPASAYSFMSGTAPNRVQHFAFRDVPGFGSMTPIVNADVRLFESTNVIEVHYGGITIRDPQRDLDASAGWEALGGSYGQDVLGCSPDCGSAQWPTNTVLRYIPTF